MTPERLEVNNSTDSAFSLVLSLLITPCGGLMCACHIRHDGSLKEMAGFLTQHLGRYCTNVNIYTHIYEAV